jgi:hypothetical protein
VNYCLIVDDSCLLPISGGETSIGQQARTGNIAGFGTLRRWRSRLRYLMIEEGETAEGSAFHKTFFISTVE